MGTSERGAAPADPVIHRAAVIGAAGFIGAPLSSALTGAHVDTACFTRTARAWDGRNALSYALHRAPVVYYLASSITPTLGERHPEWAAADQEAFGRLLLRLARRDDPPLVVLTSSGGTVYDPDVAPPYTETTPVRATGRYGQAKIGLEEELHRYAERVPGVILRLSNVYGPGQRAGKGQGVLAYWMRAALEGRPLDVIGDPGCSRDYVYIDDVVESFRRVDAALRSGRLLPAGSGGEPIVLNIGSGVPTTLDDLVTVVRDVVEKELAVQYAPGRSLDRRHVWLDVQRAHATLGWRPVTRLADGVARMWHWTREQERTGAAYAALHTAPVTP